MLHHKLYQNAVGYFILKVIKLAKKINIGVNRESMSRSTNHPSEKLDNISNYFVMKSSEIGKPITNKKVQKLAYYSQAWHLVFNEGDPMFTDSIEAWLHGPAIRSLWHKYKKYGFNPIAETPSVKGLTDDDTALLDEIWRVYGKHDAEYLEALTHSEAPWLDARQGLETNASSSIVISNDSMQKYYSQLNARQV